jgi:uncharacterized protein
MTIIITSTSDSYIAAIPAESAAIFAPATQLLYEWTDYLIDAPGATMLRVGGELLKPIRSGLFAVRFENQLGRTTIQPYLDHRPLAPATTVEVLSRKFTDPQAYHRFFSTLLDDLFLRAARLPFTFSAQTNRSVTETMQPPSPLFAFHFLCQEAAGLRAALATVQAAPHQVLADSPIYVPIHEASEVGPEVLIGILQAPDSWVEARGLPFSRQLKQRAPSHVWQRRPEETFDTPENRFVLAFIRTLAAAAELIPMQRWWNNVPSHRQRTIREVSSLLRQVIAHPMFDAVGTLHQVPSASQVLLRRAGYRELRELWQLFHRARRPLFQPLQHAIDLRDIAQLYEIWAFFALAETIGDLCGTTPVLELRLSDVDGLGWEAKAHVGTAGVLVYNAYGRSYSVALRPDYTWHGAGGDTVVLDAKFRLDRQLLDEASTSQIALATAKVADIYKMHAYRDALSVRAAVIIYPGDIALFYNQDTRKRQTLALQELLFTKLAGIGALPFRPDS